MCEKKIKSRNYSLDLSEQSSEILEQKLCHVKIPFCLQRKIGSGSKISLQLQSLKSIERITAQTRGHQFTSLEQSRGLQRVVQTETFGSKKCLERHQGGADCSVSQSPLHSSHFREDLFLYSNTTEKQDCPTPECFRVDRVMLREKKQVLVWHTAAQERSLDL